MVFSPLVGSAWDKSMVDGLPLLDAAAVVPHEGYGLNELEGTQTILERRLSGSTLSVVNAAEITPPPQRRMRRQSVVVSTDVDLIVENEDGSTVAEATLHGLPTAPVEVPLPIGTLSLPALVNTPALISLPIVDLNTGPPPSASSPVASQSLSIQIPDSSSQIVISSPPTPAPSDSTLISLSTPSSTPFPSIATFNSTTTTSSFLPSSSLASQTSNSTTSTLSSTSRSTLLTFTSSRTTSSIASSSSTLSTEISATSTGGSGGFSSGGSSVTSAVPSASSTSAAATASQSSPTYVPVVGGVLGGLAGLVLLLVAALFFLRWYKRRHRPPSQLQNDDESVPPGTSHSDAPMAYNSAAPWGAALAPFLRRMRPHSTATEATTETGTSERGFQKIGGRKIESVLVSGGDGYDYGGRGPGAGNLSGQSFYRDSSGTYGGGASQNSSMVVGPASPRKSVATSDFTDMSGIAGPSNLSRASDKEVVTMMPGPARQAVPSPAYALRSHFSGSEAAQPSSERGYSPGPTHVIRPPDPLGRSRPSHDGSRGSKFAEDVK